MKIECTIKRKGGSYVELERDTYHFAPQEDGAHVAEVEKKTHIGILLAIREAYQIYDGNAQVMEQMPVSVDPDEEAKNTGGTPGTEDPIADNGMLLGSNDHPATFDIDGVHYQLGDIVNMAFEASGLTLVEWNAQSDDNRASQIDEQLDALEVKPEGDAVTQKLADMQEATERAGLIEHYTTMFGKAPKASMKNDTLRAKIAAGV